MTRRSLAGRLPLPAALAIVLLAAGAGCGSDAAPEAGSSTAATTAGTGTTTSARSKGVAFAACMREHGIRAFPDPDASGELTLDGVVNGSTLDPDSPAWERAMTACKDLQPAGFAGHTRDAKEQAGALAFARCIREHGVGDFPDPVAGDPLVDTNKIPSANAPGGMDVLNAAMRACGDFAAKAGVRR